jgi:hypothetical protein
MKLLEKTVGRVEVQAKCPFCDDRHYHLSFNTDLQCYRCNRCLAKGNAVTLYAWRFGLSNRDSAEALIAQNYALTSVDSYQPRTRSYTAADLQVRHNVYSDFLNLLNLSDAHKRNLIGRGLSNDYIKRFMYKSVPLDAGFRRRVVSTLTETHDLRGIPGFFTDDHDNWHMFVKPQGGIFIPICDMNGYIQGLQIRLDHTRHRKYRWFSSNHFKDGTGAAPWVHVVGDITSPAACVTEGALKADTASVLSGGKLFIAVPGVHCTDNLPDVLKTLKIQRVIDGYDMDKTVNPRVSGALTKLQEMLGGLGVAYQPFKWNPQYKGIDDYLCARKAA